MCPELGSRVKEQLLQIESSFPNVLAQVHVRVCMCVLCVCVLCVCVCCVLCVCVSCVLCRECLCRECLWSVKCMFVQFLEARPMATSEVLLSQTASAETPG